MNEINIDIFRGIQEKINSFDKILFIIEDGEPNCIKRKNTKIEFIDKKVVIYKIAIYNTEIKDLIKNVNKNNVTTIEMNFTSSSLGLHEIDHFPQFLKKIIIYDFKFNLEILNNLPEDLEYLLFSYNTKEIKTELNNLPNKLKVLEMLYIKCNSSLDYLPLSLEKMVIFFKNEYNYSLNNLPPNLNYLEIGFEMIINKKTHTLNNLPEKIKYLKLQNCNGFIINKYPSNLEMLELCSKKELTNIPKNVNYKYKNHINHTLY